uniref:RING-type domain-containing protein n=1 Tax=Arcella intermedia TaxID=1963864 RepID=A0A6B2LUE2_9EUKA
MKLRLEGFNELKRVVDRTVNELQLAMMRKKDLEKFLCVVCLEREKNTVLLPCSHFLSCSLCSEGLKECPVCRIPLSGRLVCKYFEKGKE